MKILLVEDEQHKRAELIECVQKVFNLEPEIIDNVSGAVLKVISEEFHLIILDMALSTFGENAVDKVKGHDQAQGGIEVLRALKMQNKATNIIIVTQYPDFLIDGSKIKLKDSERVIKEKYNQNILGAILYTYKSATTSQRLISILRKFYENNADRR